MNTAQILINNPVKEDLNFKNKKILKFSKDNINYNIILSYNEKLILFEIEKEKENENEFPKKDFKLYLDLEQLTKVDKYFSQFESVSEIPLSFETLLGMKKIDIIYGDKESKIKIINPLNKKEFYICIPLKEKSLKNEIDALIPYIASLNDKINKMENRINLLENKVNDLILFKDIIEKKFKLFHESNIIKSEDIKIILSWFDKKPLKFNLLLDMKRDGDSTKIFHQQCGNKSPTILFFKTKSGARFGGFTTQFWPTKGQQKDEKSFVFSLNKKEKYKVINTAKAICGWENYFQFGTCCFRIYDKCSSTNENYINNDKNYYDIPDNYGLTDGENKFTISTYEVYQIEF